jgi:hypothetical protein
MEETSMFKKSFTAKYQNEFRNQNPVREGPRKELATGQVIGMDMDRSVTQMGYLTRFFAVWRCRLFHSRSLCGKSSSAIRHPPSAIRKAGAQHHGKSNCVFGVS